MRLVTLLMLAGIPAWATTVPQPVPEPATVLLVGGGLGALILIARRRRSRE